jgi:hypothetical protein
MESINIITMVDMVTRKYNKYPEINKYSDMIRG